MRKIIPFSLCALVGALLLSADVPGPAGSSLSSSHAAYDGNALILTGHVVLDHGLGQMQAEKASLQKQEVGTDFPFTLIELRKDVVLQLKNDSKISCARADLDFSQLKGLLFSEENAVVTFSDKVKKNTPIKLTSQNAELTFSKGEDAQKKSTYAIETILATENVKVEYAGSFILHAGKAVYKKLPSKSGPAKNELDATISTYPKDDATPCTLAHEEDLIQAKNIDLDLPSGKITMQAPQGVLASSLFPRMKKGTLAFQSDHLLWDQGKNTLTLQGKAFVKEEEVGSIRADEELRFAYMEKEGKKFIKTIDSQGTAVLNYGSHQLTCHGPIHLDRENLNASLSSPTTDGVVPKEKQISYEEGEVKICGDKALMEYALFDDLLHPVSLVLKDHVRLFSKNAAMHRRWALADRLTYSPSTRTFILTANPGNKVLFRDEEGAVAVSAQEVHVTFDPETKKERIQGVGKVQLSFSSDEINLLKKMFPSYE